MPRRGPRDERKQVQVLSMASERYDVAVVGAGPAGVAAALTAARAG